MIRTAILVAAYGRTYTTADEAWKDWTEGKDFRIVCGPYCSIRDMTQLREMYQYILIRFGDNSVLEL